MKFQLRCIIKFKGMRENVVPNENVEVLVWIRLSAFKSTQTYPNLDFEKPQHPNTALIIVKSQRLSLGFAAFWLCLNVKVLFYMDCLYEFTNCCSISFHKATKNGGGPEKTSKFVY